MTVRVLHLDTEPGFRGGQRQLLLLSRGLAERGHHSSVFARRGGPLAAACRDGGIPVRESPQVVPWDPRPVRAVRGWLRREPVDVVHAHASHALGTAVAALATIPTPHRPPLVASRRVDFPVSRGPKYGPRVALFLAVSRAVADVLERGGVEPARIAVVRSGVPPLAPPLRSPRDVRRTLGIPDDAILLLSTAALVDHKDHATAIRAMARCRPGTVLAIAGEGPLRGELARLIADEKLSERVRLLGQRDDVPDLLSACDAYLAASHLEGLGTALLDAGLAGRPVVACAAGGIPEVVDDGETGLLVPPRDPGALAGAIDRLAADAGLRQRLGLAAAARVADRFSVDRMVEGTVQAYREVIAP